MPASTTSRPSSTSCSRRACAKYGTNFVSAESDMGSGEMGGFQTVKGALVTIMQAPPLYHTTGETLDVISTPGLERVARFLGFFLSSVDKAARTQINP